MAYGVDCFECREAAPTAETIDEAHRLASEAGYVLALDGRGQAHIVCSNCKVCYYRPVPLVI